MTSIASWTTRIGAALLGAVLFISAPAYAGDCCGGGEKEAAVKSGTPEECFASIACAMEAGNKDGIYNLLTVESQEALVKKGEELKAVAEKCEDTQKALGMTADQVKAASGKDLMLTMMLVHVKAAAAAKAEADKKAAGTDNTKECKDCHAISDVKVDGDKATAVCPFGMPLAFEKGKDGWRLDIRAMLNANCDKKDDGAGCDGKEDGGCCDDGKKAGE